MSRVRRLVAALRDARGSMTILTAGVLVVILMVTGVGVAITGVHLERNALQDAADASALAAAQAVDPGGFYGGGGPVAVDADAARRAAEEHLALHAVDGRRTTGLAVTSVDVAADGSVRVEVRARTDPPLVGWFTAGTGTSIELVTVGEARAS